MPQPFWQLGTVISTTHETPARRCLSRGYRRIRLPPGRYLIREVWRDNEDWRAPQFSYGYTYRLDVLDETSPHFGCRVSIWQSDLIDATAN